jgi:hypothetical protein
MIVTFAEELKALTSDYLLYFNDRISNIPLVTINGTYYADISMVAEYLGVEAVVNSSSKSVNLKGVIPISKDFLKQNFAAGNYLGTVKYTYDNGTTYSGGYKNGKFHGIGKVVYSNGTIYDGNFVEGRLEGKGKYTAINGDMYVGAFVNDSFEGYGTYTYANGDVIKGMFNGDELVSAVVYVNLKAEQLEKTVQKWDRPLQKVEFYDRSIRENLYNGTAIVTYTNGVTYNGFVSYNTFHGKGKIVYPDGSCYDGFWVKDHRVGKGIYTYANGEIYDGYFLNDLYEGLGTFKYNNGDSFTGQWEKGKKNGNGIYTYANGDKFEGHWENDLIDTIGYLAPRADAYYKDYGRFTVDKKNIYIRNAIYRDIRPKVYFQKWIDGKLINQRNL